MISQREIRNSRTVLVKFLVAFLMIVYFEIRNSLFPDKRNMHKTVSELKLFGELLSEAFLPFMISRDI